MEKENMPGRNPDDQEPKPTLRLKLNPNNTLSVVPRNDAELRAAMVLGLNYTTPVKR